MTVTIKAWTNRNTKVEWSYDTAEQSAAFWAKLTETGRAPDTGEALSRAYWYGPAHAPGRGPDKAWAA